MFSEPSTLNRLAEESIGLCVNRAKFAKSRTTNATGSSFNCAAIAFRLHRMNHFSCALVAASVLLVAMLIGGCGDEPGSKAAPENLVGHWAGEGKFSARAGSMDVKAQLELNADQTYRMLILEPGILALTGPETGEWSRSGSAVTLTPTRPPKSDHADTTVGPIQPGDSVLGKLRESSDPEDMPVKQLTLADDRTTLKLNDGKLSITFGYTQK